MKTLPDSCGPRSGPYRGGKTFEQCREDARKNSVELAHEISLLGEISWSRVLEAADHDELVYKLTLKYLRQAGHDIGSGSVPRVSMK